MSDSSQTKIKRRSNLHQLLSIGVISIVVTYVFLQIRMEKIEQLVSDKTVVVNFSRYQRLSENLVSENEIVPVVVKSWRSGKFDWHDLLISQSPTSPMEKEYLKSKQRLVTRFLTKNYLKYAKLNYGLNFGTLTHYSACEIFPNTCIIHDKYDCEENELCRWNRSLDLCMENFRGLSSLSSSHNNRSCSSPVTIHGSSISNHSGKCKYLVTTPAYFLKMIDQSQTMFYHWWPTFVNIFTLWKKNKCRKSHIIIPKIYDSQFFHYFGLLSDFCWRRSEFDVPEGTCFCNL